MLLAMMASSTEQSLSELNEKETREKLSHWDIRTEPMAPLTDKQTDSILEIRAAAEESPIPPEVSEVSCSLAAELTSYYLYQHTYCVPL